MTKENLSKKAGEIKELIQSFVNECEKKYKQKMDCYVIEITDDNTVEFRFDSTLYEIIEYYFSDGYNTFKLGEKYETLFDGSGWMSEPYSPGVHRVYNQEV